MRTILTNCTVIDGTGRAPLEDRTVIVDDNRITALRAGPYQSSACESGDVRVFDLAGGYVLPGLWNVHTHIGGLFPHLRTTQHTMASESTADRTIRAGRNLMDALRQGVTGVRVVGEQDDIDVAWRDAFNAGVFVGPRLFVCGTAISPTGGWGESGADGPYEIRKAVREQLKHGVDQIKLAATGGHAQMIAAGVGEAMRERNLLLDEIRAATEVAHMKGKHVCAHASNPGIKVAIQGGVDCIEHGYYLDDEAIQMMLDHDVFYVPTLVCNEEEALMREQGGLDRFHPGRVMIAQGEGVTPDYAQYHVEAFQKALAAGVKIACGGEPSPVGEYALLEIEHMVRAGMTELAAIVAATRTCAALCGVEDDVGTVEAEKIADLIVTAEDPLQDISNLRRLTLVLKEGVVVDTETPEGVEDFWELFYF